MPDPAQAAVHGRARPLHATSQGQGQGLHAQAHAQDGDGRGWRAAAVLTTTHPGRPAQEVQAHAHVARDGRAAGPGRDDDVVPLARRQAGPQVGPGQGVVVQDGGRG